MQPSRGEGRDWPSVGEQPPNYESHAVRLIEDIKAVTSVIQAFPAGGKNAVPERVVSALCANIEIFIGKTKGVKDLNILYTLKSIEAKIDRQANISQALPQKTYAQIAVQAARHQNAAITASI